MDNKQIVALLAEKAAGLSAFDIAVALSLYGYNVPAAERARKLYECFRDEYSGQDGLMAMIDLCEIIKDRNAAYVATELAAPWAAVYVLHALERYGAEAAERNRINLAGIEALL